MQLPKSAVHLLGGVALMVSMNAQVTPANAEITCRSISYAATVPVRRGESTISAQRGALRGLYQRAARRGLARSRLQNVRVSCRYVAWEGAWRGVRCTASARFCLLRRSTRPQRHRGPIFPVSRRD